MKIIASCTCRIALFQLQLFEPSFETSVSSGNALFALKLIYLYLLHTWLSWRVMLWWSQKTSLGTVRYELTVAKHRRTCQLTTCPQPETVAPFQSHHMTVPNTSRTCESHQMTVARHRRIFQSHHMTVPKDRRTFHSHHMTVPSKESHPWVAANDRSRRRVAPCSRTRWP